MKSRIRSFSVKPDDKKAIAEIDKLDMYQRKTGINFSILIIRAIKMLNEELANDRR